MFASLRSSLSFMSRKERFVYFFLISLRALSGLLDVVGIALIGLIAGLASTSFSPGKPLVILGFTLPTVSEQTLVILVSIVLLVFIFKALIAVLLMRSISLFLSRVETEKAVEIADFLFSSNLDHLQGLSKGEILWTVMGSTSMAYSGLLVSLSTFFAEGILLILVALTFALVDPVATLFVFFYFATLVISIQFAISKRIRKAGVDAGYGSMKSTEAIDDLLDAYREITIFRKKSYFIGEFEKNRSSLSRSGGTLVFFAGMPRYVVETGLMLGVVIFVGYQFFTGQLSSGLVTVGVFLTGGVRMMASLLPLQNAVGSVKSQGEQAKNAFELLGQSRESQRIAAKEMSSHGLAQGEYVDTEESFIISGALGVQLDNVSYTYPSADQPAICNVSLEIRPGQHVAIIGPSGAGKTTLVDLILGLISPSQGSVSIDGTAPAAIIDKLPGVISYVPQKPGIVSGSIANNVALGEPENQIDEDKVWKALESSHLADFVKTLPEGIHTSVGSQADSLSGGQIQRLGMARALYEQPKLLVLDEATSALDASSEAAITESLNELANEVTVIVIAHRLSTVQHSDNVFVVEDGQITSSGTFSNLRKTVPMVAEYVQLMSFDD